MFVTFIFNLTIFDDFFKGRFIIASFLLHLIVGLEKILSKDAAKRKLNEE